MEKAISQSSGGIAKTWKGHPQFGRLVLLIIFMEIRDGIHQIPNANNFFVGWSKRPSQETFEQILRNSSIVVGAFDENGRVIGFATALTDGALAAYISLIEVLPEYQGKGVGRALIERIMERLGDLYMIDTVCDEHLVGFYEKFGMKRGVAMTKRNYE